MIVAIADTHTTIWYLFADPRLGKAASALIDDATANGDHIGVSAISLAEMVYLIEKHRIPASALDDLYTAAADSTVILKHIPFDEEIAMKMTEISRQHIPDLPDRIIAATASSLGVPLLSRDGRIRSSGIPTIW